MYKMKKAFTMIEIVFVIVIIGILAAVAIPRLAATRDDAEISKARVLIASVRNALAMERQKRILRGEFAPITSVGDATNVFGTFKTGVNVDTQVDVLEYPVTSERKRHHWSWDGWSNGAFWYAFCLTDGCHANPDAVWFVVRNGKFQCVDNASRNYGKCSTLGIDSIPGW